MEFGCLVIGTFSHPWKRTRNFGHVHCGWSTPVMVSCLLPSGKHTKNYGKSPFSMGKPPINGPFSMAMLNYQRVTQVLSFINPSLKLEWALHQLRKRTGAPTVMIRFWGTNFSSYTSYDCGYHLGTRVLTHNHVCLTNLANFTLFCTNNENHDLWTHNHVCPSIACYFFQLHIISCPILAHAIDDLWYPLII